MNFKSLKSALPFISTVISILTIAISAYSFYWQRDFATCEEIEIYRPPKIEQAMDIGMTITSQDGKGLVASIHDKFTLINKSSKSIIIYSWDIFFPNDYGLGVSLRALIPSPLYDLYVNGSYYSEISEILPFHMPPYSAFQFKANFRLPIIMSALEDI